MPVNTTVATTAMQLYVIDGALPEIDTLIQSIGPDRAIFILDPTKDGILQLAERLSQESGLDAIHILSHGSPGSLLLGSSLFNQDTLSQYTKALVVIGAALSDTGDILLYGCNVATGQEGLTFVNQLAQVTRADLAASTNLTGGVSFGGDWVLEARIGKIETASVAPTGLKGTLASVTGTDLSEELLGAFGDDVIYGLGGNDTIDGQAGSDSIDGGDGDDSIIGNFGNDTLLGGAGDDTLFDDQGSNLLDGGTGNDSLTARSLTGSHTLMGGLGSDNLSATGLVLSLDGGDDNDYLSATGQMYAGGGTSYVSGGSASLSGGAGTDSLNVDSYSSASLSGGDGNDSLYVGSTRSASLSGGGGDDSLYVSVIGYSSSGTDGDSRVNKSATLDGGDGNDALTVSAYTLRYYGQTTVLLQGGAGNDRLSVTDNSAGDTGNSGQEYGIASASLEGGAGEDLLSAGGALHLSLSGGAGADTFALTAQQYRTLLEGTRSFQGVDN